MTEHVRKVLRQLDAGIITEHEARNKIVEVTLTFLQTYGEDDNK